MYTSRIAIEESTALSRPAVLRWPTGGRILTIEDLNAYDAAMERQATRDAMVTYDRATIDGAGAFLIGELERFDATVNEPLVSVKWSRDIQLREDITIADELASWSNTTFAALGMNPNGKSWIGKDINAIQGVALDIGKTAQPLNLWGQELSWTITELASAERIGRPVDLQKADVMKLKWEMDTDEQAYIGDSVLPNVYGLANSPSVSIVSSSLVGTQNGVTAGTTASGYWLNKTPQQKLNDVNSVIQSTWQATGYAVAPKKIILPPAQFGFISEEIVSQAGSISTLSYLRLNSVSTVENGEPLDIVSSKWLPARGTAGTDRMVIYTNDKKYLRLPRTQLSRTPVEYRSLWQLTTYYGRLGQIEFVYPETISYMDGI